MASNILIIEDDAAFRKTVTNILRLHGFTAAAVPSGKAGVKRAEKEPPDLVLLDLVMPGMSGLEVCQALKQEEHTAGIPILILTGEDKDGQDIACLDMGADDYLTKPVKTERLIAHCRALLRRTKSAATASPHLQLGDLTLDHDAKRVSLKGRDYPHLTPKEFDLLYHLASCSPKPQDRETLYRKVWGMEPPSPGSLKTVEVHVRRIRLKLGWSAKQWLTAVSGRGYSLTPPGGN
ncbi:MAG: response regulator transcription factor [Elusimicrobiota bacterium]